MDTANINHTQVLSKKSKSTKLFLRFGLTLAVEIVFLFTILLVISVRTVQKSTAINYSDFCRSLVDAQAQGLSYRNSKFMQQLRMYTMSDIINGKSKSDFPSTEKIASWLSDHKSVRSGDFYGVIYCDAATGTGYSDDGKVIDVSQEQFFKSIVSGNKSQYIDDPALLQNGLAGYHVCKSVKVNDKVVGFFTALVTTDMLQDAIDKIKVGEAGYGFLLASDGTITAFPDRSIILKQNFLQADQAGYKGLSAIAQAMTKGESGAGWINNLSKSKDLVAYTPVPDRKSVV